MDSVVPTASEIPLSEPIGQGMLDSTAPSAEVTDRTATRKGNLRRILLSALSAVLLAFCFPFVSAWWLAWIALIPLYYSLISAQGNAKAGAICGFWFGLVLHLVGVFWMEKLGTVPWIGVSIFESGAFALMGAIAAPLLFRLPTFARPVFFAALWTCLEYLRAQGAMAFPWFPLAATQVPCLPMVQIVSITGQWGLSFAIALVNGLLLEAAQAHRLRDTFTFRILTGVAVYVPLLLAFGGELVIITYSFHENPLYPPSRPQRQIVGIVQGNVGKIPENADQSEYREIALNTYLQMTRFVPKQDGPDGQLSFILWPETVVPGYLLQDPMLQFPVAQLAREMHTNLLVGTEDAGLGNERFNSIVHLDPTGRVVRKYAKQRLVPMGEFFVFREQLGKIYDKYNVPNDDLTPGREPGTFTVGEGKQAAKIGMLICYESVFPYISRDRVNAGAQFLVQATSDQTFDGTPNPQQHADLAVLRAVETRRYFIRAGATGYSEVIDAGGTVRRKLPGNKAGVIKAEVVPRDGKTFFVRFGDWFVRLSFLVVVVSGLWGFFFRQRVGLVETPTPSTEEAELPEQTSPPSSAP